MDIVLSRIEIVFESKFKSKRERERENKWSPSILFRFITKMENKKQIFTEQERMIFLEILKKYMKIVEFKETHSAALKAKNKAWQRIAMEFNMNPLTNYTVS